MLRFFLLRSRCHRHLLRRPGLGRLAPFSLALKLADKVMRVLFPPEACALGIGQRCRALGFNPLTDRIDRRPLRLVLRAGPATVRPTAQCSPMQPCPSKLPTIAECASHEDIRFRPARHCFGIHARSTLRRAPNNAHASTPQMLRVLPPRFLRRLPPLRAQLPCLVLPIVLGAA